MTQCMQLGASPQCVHVRLQFGRHVDTLYGMRVFINSDEGAVYRCMGVLKYCVVWTMFADACFELVVAVE